MYGEPVGTIDISQSGYLTTSNITTINKTVNSPDRIFHIHLISTSGGGSVLIVANGQGGTQRINITGTTSKGIDFDFGINGITFPLGAYITVDNNLSNAAITGRREQF